MPNVTLDQHLAIAQDDRDVLGLLAVALEDDEIAKATGLELEEVRRRMSAFLAQIDAEDRFATVWAIKHVSCCAAAT